MQVGTQTFHTIHTEPASFAFVKWNKFCLAVVFSHKTYRAGTAIMSLYESEDNG